MDNNILINSKNTITNEINQLQSFSNTLIASNFSVGFITQYAASSSNVPNGWLICDGSSINKNIYVSLFDTIGYTYGGSGDNFNIPDLRGRIPVGYNTSGTFNRLNKAEGLEKVRLVADNIPSHYHYSFQNSLLSSSYQMNVNSIAATRVQNGLVTAYAISGTDVVTPSLGLTTDNGYSVPTQIDNMPPCIVINYIIFAGA